MTGGQIDHVQIVTKVTSKSVIVAQHSRNYEHSLKWVTKTSIPRNAAWKNFTYTVVRPNHTMINIGS